MIGSTPLSGVAFAALTHPGVRAHNEDAVFAAPEHGLFLVADGCGGPGLGDAACAILLSCLQEAPATPVAQLLEANVRIHAAARSDSRLRRMGATAALVQLQGERAVIAHVGEARAYLVRDGKLSQLTEDHTLAAQLIKLGQLAPEAAASHPARKTLLRYLGKAPALEPEVRDLPLQPGDLLLLCTDGVYTSLAPDALIRLASGASDALQDRVAAAIQEAIARGAEDNLGLVAIRIPDRSAAPAGGAAVATQLRGLVEALLSSASPEADLARFCDDLLALVVAESGAASGALALETGGERRLLAGQAGGREVVLPVPGDAGPTGRLALLLTPGALGLDRQAIAPYLELAAWYHPLARIAAERARWS